jgi:15-cis-phytoene synthase
MPPALESHSARYFALLYSASTQHVILESLLGIEQEVFESLRPGLDHHVAHSRLQWWREECERTSAGQPVHPLTRALVDGLRMEPAGGTPLGALGGLAGFVDVAVWDLASATFETRREVIAYCGRWAAAMFTGAGIGTGGTGVATRPGAASAGAAQTDWGAAGAAIREIELLTDLAHEAHRGRVRVPLDELERIAIDPASLAKPPWPEAVAAILRSRHQALRGEIARGLANLDRQQQPALRGLLVWAALAYRASQRAERALPDRLQTGRFDAISDAWSAWRVARKATVGRFRLS